MNNPPFTLTPRPLVLCAAFAFGCVGDSQPVDTSDGEAGTETDADTGDTGGPGELGPCDFPPADPGRLLVTTTDFATGAISTATVASQTVDADVALGSTDAIPFVHDGRVYIVHRFGFDRVDMLDAADLTLLGEFPVEAAGAASANPHSVAIGPDGLGYVTLNGAPEVQVLDFSQPAQSAKVDSISLDAFADEDGNAEASMSLACGDHLFVSVQRLDANFEPVDAEALAVVDMRARDLVDTDPDTAGTQGIDLNGHFAKQVRRDPEDARGTTALVLTTGIERVNFQTYEVEWVVDENEFVDAGFSDPRFQVQSFDLHGETAYVAAYVDDFSEVKLLRTPLSGGAVEEIAGGLNAVEKTLEVVGDELWFGDTTVGASGLRVFDLSSDPPTEVAGPLPTGLPPYSIVGLP